MVAFQQHPRALLRVDIESPPVEAHQGAFDGGPARDLTEIQGLGLGADLDEAPAGINGRARSATRYLIRYGWIKPDSVIVILLMVIVALCAPGWRYRPQKTGSGEQNPVEAGDTSARTGPCPRSRRMSGCGPPPPSEVTPGCTEPSAATSSPAGYAMKEVVGRDSRNDLLRPVVGVRLAGNQRICGSGTRRPIMTPVPGAPQCDEVDRGESSRSRPGHGDGTADPHLARALGQR